MDTNGALLRGLLTAEKTSMTHIRTKRIVIPVSLLVIVTLTQLPVFGVTAPATVIVLGCKKVSPRDIPFLGSAGAIRFGCVGRAAFSATGNAVPDFVLTTGYDSLGIILHSTGNCLSSTRLEPNRPFAFTGRRQEYDYCAFLVDNAVKELGGFDLEWRIGRRAPQS